nr:MAG TPA: hypothetical protein [Caudoviricetes sp.]
MARADLRAHFSAWIGASVSIPPISTNTPESH